MALLEPRVERIAPQVAEPAADRAPDSIASGTPEPLRGELVELLGEDRVLTRALDLVRYASDASPYRLFPKAVVLPREAGEIANLFAYARRARVPIVFRAGGTSLNGQAQGDGILVDVRRHFRGVAIEDGGTSVRVKPGEILGHVNAALAPLGRKLGPDPASTDIATVGGVIANNSGGMRCGVVHDSYQTLRSLTFVLPSGTTIDTAAPGADRRFEETEPELARGLTEIRDEIRADVELTARIRSKFEIKNTTGYRLIAFLDADTPLEIFRRLVVGSEGTLAFVAEAVFETIPFGRQTSTAMLLFPGIDEAVGAVPELVAAGASAVELMVAATLKVAQAIVETPQSWKDAPMEAAAVLVELRTDDAGELAELEAKAQRVLEGRPLLEPPAFTRDPEMTEMFWRVREGMHGLVGRLRPHGTSLIMEDVCVRPERVAEAAKDLQALLTKHQFLAGVAGHASAGNLHFMLTPTFTDPADRDRYDAFMGELADLVVDKYDGSLKAEHGTGLNMAPFVEREWGSKATELMWRVKSLADPEGLLAPGVLLNRDPEVHLRNLKSTPPIEKAADACVECGFCEPVCPSRDLTTTPRQRIVVRREMARQPPSSPVLRALLEQYEYDGIETCAADGSCRLACPLGIDTGTLIKEFRERQRSARGELLALRAARHWGQVERAARGGLRAGGAVARVFGDGAMRSVTRGLRRVASPELMPEWTGAMPRAASRKLPRTKQEGAAAVYMPACINRIFGNPREAPPRPSVPEALVAVSFRAGVPLWIPEGTAGRCCATPWISKGYREGAALMANGTVDALWKWSREGALPVVTDASSCAHTLVDEVPTLLTDENRKRHERLTVLDSVAWARDRLLPGLTVARRLRSVAVHPTCSLRHLGLVGDLETVARQLADEVVVPRTATCCGFAGDRGLLHPELTATATREEAEEIGSRRFDAYLSSNRTCEIGLQEATGAPYSSFVPVLEELTRPAA